jgi:uncharacterized protein involved in exopolysaccharide biosynthesis
MSTVSGDTGVAGTRTAANRGSSAETASTSDTEIGLNELLTVLTRRWRMIVAIPFAAGLFAAIFSLLIAPAYTATSSIVPEADPVPRLPAGLAGLSSQLGFSLGSQGTRSPRFYAEVLKSRDLRERILLARYRHPSRPARSADSTRLLDMLAVDGDDASDSIHNGLKALDELVTVQVDDQTSVVRLEVESRYSQLAADVANRFVRYLNEFNTSTRQSQVRERRRFVEARLREAEADLLRSEEQVEAFYERNRSWQHSPQLVSEQARLERQGVIRQEVFLTLRREYESARIEEVNDTPVITVIDSAVPPSRRSKPRRGQMVTLAFFSGGLLAVFVAFGAEYLRHARRVG